MLYKREKSSCLTLVFVFVSCSETVKQHMLLGLMSVWWRCSLWNRPSLRSDALSSSLLLFLSRTNPLTLISTLHISSWRLPGVFDRSQFVAVVLKYISIHISRHASVRWWHTDNCSRVNVTTKVKVYDGEMLKYCLFFFVSYQAQKVTLMTLSRADVSDWQFEAHDLLWWYTVDTVLRCLDITMTGFSRSLICWSLFYLFF